MRTRMSVRHTVRHVSNSSWWKLLIQIAEKENLLVKIKRQLCTKRCLANPAMTCGRLKMNWCPDRWDIFIRRAQGEIKLMHRHRALKGSFDKFSSSDAFMRAQWHFRSSSRDLLAKKGKNLSICIGSKWQHLQQQFVSHKCECWIWALLKITQQERTCKSCRKLTMIAYDMENLGWRLCEWTWCDNLRQLINYIFWMLWYAWLDLGSSIATQTPCKFTIGNLYKKQRLTIPFHYNHLILNEI